MRDVYIKLNDVSYRLIVLKTGISHIQDLLMMAVSCSAVLLDPPFTGYVFDVLVCVHSKQQIREENINIWQRENHAVVFFHHRYDIFVVLKPFLFEELDRENIDQISEFQHLRFALLPL